MKKIAIIGTGRVGVPLALYLETLGFGVVGIDRDVALIKRLRDRIMPFEEPGCQELLSRSHAFFTDEIARVAETDHIFITVGTPLMPHIETDLSNVEAVMRSLLPHLHSGQSILLRSTVAPRTTHYLATYLESHTSLRVGKDLAMAFCPERLAEQKALAELPKLPQIIGCEDNFSFEKAREVFSLFPVKLLQTNYVSAELAKLFNNSARYIEFAVANQFAIYAHMFDQNIYEILKLSNEDYPRGFIYRPGLTAGTCLRKDFGMINELSSGSDLLLAAWKINEFMPYHLMDLTSRYKPLNGARVAILGYTFKRNSDDVRDSLVPKLMRYVERHVPRSMEICEPNLDVKTIERYPNRDLRTVLKDADVVFIAVDHDEFRQEGAVWNQVKQGTVVMDIWNCLKRDRVISVKGEA